MFPLSVEGVIDPPPGGTDAVLDRLAVAAGAVGAKSLERNSTKLKFRGLGPWVKRSNPLSCFDYCEIVFQSGKLTYDCSTRHLLLLTTAFVVFFWFAILSSNPELPATLLVIIPIVVWLLAFGANYLLGLGQFRNFLSSALLSTSAGEKQ
jgi:hypothetical protein